MVPAVAKQQARRARKVAEGVADHEVSAVVVAGGAEIARAVDTADVSRQAERDDVPHIGGPFTGVENEQPVFLPEVLDFIGRPLMEMLG